MMFDDIVRRSLKFTKVEFYKNLFIITTSIKFLNLIY